MYPIAFPRGRSLLALPGVRFRITRLDPKNLMVTFADTPNRSTYCELARQPLDADQCALIVIDIQEKLLPPIFERERLVRNSQLLDSRSPHPENTDAPQHAVRQGIGSNRPCHRLLTPDTDAIDKNLFSCFASDVFCSVIEGLPGQRNTLLLCGMESHICVMQTALGSSACRTSRSCRVRRRQFPHRMELEGGTRSHALCRRYHLVDRNDDL